MADEKKKTEIILFKWPPAWTFSIAFLILLSAKVFNFYDLHWLVVTSPLWGPIALCLAFFAIAIVVAIVVLAIVFLLALISEILKAIYNVFRRLFLLLFGKKDRKEDNDDYQLHS